MFGDSDPALAGGGGSPKISSKGTSFGSVLLLGSTGVDSNGAKVGGGGGASNGLEASAGGGGGASNGLEASAGGGASKG